MTQGAFNRPSMLHAPTNGSRVNARKLSPSSKCSGCSIVSNPKISSAVSGLSFSGSPSAVVRAVMSIVINAVNAVVFRWPNTHIIDEVLERCFPSGANRDSTPTVSGLFAVRCPEASTFHFTPNGVLFWINSIRGYTRFSHFDTSSIGVVRGRLLAQPVPDIITNGAVA